MKDMPMEILITLTQIKMDFAEKKSVTVYDSKLIVCLTSKLHQK